MKDRPRRLKVYVGDLGRNSRVTFDGEVIPGVCNASIDIDARQMTTVLVRINMTDCEIIQTGDKQL